MAFAVRNRLNTLQLLHREGAMPVIMQPYGHSSGNDIQMLPEDLRGDHSILRAEMAGLIEFLDTEAATKAVRQQIEVSRTESAAAAEAVTDSLDIAAVDSVMMGVICMGPGEKAGHNCEMPLAMTVAALRTQPPLCPSHLSYTDRCAIVTGTDGHQAWARIR